MGNKNKFTFILITLIIFSAVFTFCEETEHEEDDEESLQPTAKTTLKAEKIPKKTDDEVADREERSRSRDGRSENEKRAAAENSEKFQFQAEVNKIMKIIVHSLYSNKEIFLRELISNASDALDKIRFQSLTNPSVLDSNKNLDIRIKADKEARTITISDTGIGMTKQELITNLGTIAQSGTAAFAEALETGTINNLIGQFGVGFYSAYLVADKITVVSKHNDDPQQWIWESSTQDSFTITPDPEGNTLGRGTSVTLALKVDPDNYQEMDDYLNPEKLRELAIKYSQFINFPIYLWASHEEDREVPDEEAEKEEEEKEEEDAELDELDLDEDKEEEGEEKKPKTKIVKETVWEWDRLNLTKPIWLRNKKDVTDAEYIEFYKAITKDTEAPVTYIHFAAEGDVDFKAILYLPSEPPYGQFDPSIRQKGVKLYVKRVFITDDFDTVIPKYLTFLKGVVDSDAIPLNISREMLQENKALDAIKKKLVRKAVAMFQMLAQEDKEKYDKFWENYGVNLKLGVIEDVQNRSRLSKLLRFKSSKSTGFVSLDDYVERMKKGQDQIYFLAGTNVDELKQSPLLEKLFAKDYEVLFLTEPIDEYVMQNIPKYEAKYKITNVGKEDVQVTADSPDQDEDEAKEKKEREEQEQQLQELIQYFKTNFSDTVGKVKISSRLIKSPCALVAESWGYTATMERVARSQALADKKMTSMWMGKKVLEINPKHPIITSLNDLLKTEGDESKKVKSIASLLIDAAAVSSGYNVADSPTFVRNLNNALLLNLGLEPVEEEEVTDEPVVQQEEHKKDDHKTGHDDDDDDHKDEDHDL